MSEEDVQETAETTVDETDDSSGELSYEDLKKELEKTRREAAAKRIKNRELEDKAAKYDEHIKSQLSEVEKLQLELREAREENEKLKSTSVRDEVAREFGLEPEMAQLFLGDTDDEEVLRKRAEALSGKSSKDAPKTKAASFAGKRGGPVKPTAKESDDPFADMLLDLWRKDDEKRFSA